MYRRACRLIALTALAACAPEAGRTSLLPMNWQPVDSLNRDLPEGVRVYAGQNDSLPLRAWYVRVAEPDPAITTRIVVSDDMTDNRETVTSFANDLGSCVVVNGGYFTMDVTPALGVGLLISDYVTWKPATRAVRRDTLSFETDSGLKVCCSPRSRH